MKKYRDHYFKQAKKQNYPARSVFKLQEMDKRFGLLSSGLKVLDLGAAPGSWSFYAAKKVGPKGEILAIDLLEIDIDLPRQVTCLQSDILEPSEKLISILEQRQPFDLILSDIAPQTTGIKVRDQTKSLELAEAVLDYAKKYLISKGNFVVKIFTGPDVEEFKNELKLNFKRLKIFKPKSSRSESKESFLLGFSFKDQV